MKHIITKDLEIGDLILKKMRIRRNHETITVETLGLVTRKTDEKVSIKWSDLDSISVYGPCAVFPARWHKLIRK